MSYCLPRAEGEKLLSAIADGTFTPDEYAAQPNTEARRAYVAKFVGEGEAKEVNTALESKMLLKDWQRGMVTAVKKMTGLSASAKRDFVTQISNMKEMLSPEDEQHFYADIAAKKLGLPTTMEVAQKINELAQKANEARNAPTDSPIGVSDEYLKAASDLRGYIASQEPVSAIAEIFRNISTTMRNFLLMNLAIPIKTITGQTENLVLDSITRRLATGVAKGAVDKGFYKNAAKTLWKTYRETGLDGTKMATLDDTGKLGEGHRFDTPTGMLSKNPVARGVEATTRAMAKWTNKVAIDWEHNIAFVKFHQKAFLDMANIMATKFAGGDSVKATEIFKDALKISPETEMGRNVRDLARFNAARVVGTQDTYMARVSQYVVNEMNKKVPGLGNFVFQIMKIPTNLISYSIENAGGGLITGPKAMYEGRRMMASTDLPTQYEGAARFARGTQTLIRTAGVMTVAAAIASQLSKKDFKTDRYGQSYVKLGFLPWINMEYFYAIDPALAGMMEVKKGWKPHETGTDVGAQYLTGVGEAVQRAPLIDTTEQLITALLNPNYSKGIGKYLGSEANARLQPAFLKQLESGQGIKGLFFSTSGLPTQKELSKLGAK